MKKTIAILLVLVIGMTGVFAAGVDGLTDDNTATINLTVSVDEVALFGVSEAALVAADYLSTAAFTAKVNSTMNVATQAMTGFKSAKHIGYLSGINNSLGPVTLDITTTPFTSETASSASIGLTVSPTTATIVAANSNLGTLASTSITIVETTAGSIDLAPAADDYTATITITVNAS